MPKRQSTSFECAVSQVKNAADWVEKAAIEAGLDGKAPLRLALIAEELFANTLHHGQPSGDDRIELEIEADGKDVRLTYRDSGIPFDLLSVDVPNAPDLESWPIGGLGLRLIRNFSSGSAYRRTNDQNVTTIWITSD